MNVYFVGGVKSSERQQSIEMQKSVTACYTAGC